MKRFTPVNKISAAAAWAIVAILALLPFHAFLTVWLSSITGHYTALRLWKEVLLVPITLTTVFLLIKNRRLTKNIFRLWAVRLILLYMLVVVISAVTAKAAGNVSAKAMWYGLLVDLRFLVFFLDVLVIASYSKLLDMVWRNALIIPAVLVSAFAILQYLVLPYDFLKHFGYGDSTIKPYEAISHTTQNIRVASTLRGANNLGAYLIIPLSAIAALLFKERAQSRNKLVMGGGFLLALAFSFSRSAWIGALTAIIVAAWLSLHSPRYRKVIAWGFAALLVICVIIGSALHNNTRFQDIFLHTDHTSKVVTSSNGGHLKAAKDALKDIAHQPLGRGVGTAGPQSVYNSHPGRIAENYYLQIGQEAGVIGMVLFIAICFAVGRMLYSRRDDPLALALFASLIGITIVNLLSHAWTDDTLSYVWWGLAGICLTPAIIKNKNNQQNGQKIKKPQRLSPIH